MPVDKVILFGSYASKNATEQSDINICFPSTILTGSAAMSICAGQRDARRETPKRLAALRGAFSFGGLVLRQAGCINWISRVTRAHKMRRCGSTFFVCLSQKGELKMLVHLCLSFPISASRAGCMQWVYRAFDILTIISRCLSLITENPKASLGIVSTIFFISTGL